MSGTSTLGRATLGCLTLARAARHAGKALYWFFDVLLPPRCPACRTVVAVVGSFCGDCWWELRFITAPMCVACGNPFEVDHGIGTTCGACLLRPPRYTAARVALVYHGSASKVLLGFKHIDRDYLARLMASQMIRAAREILTADAVLVPEPRHRWRLLRRGYNHASLLAASIARRSVTPLAVDALERHRNEQGHAPEAARHQRPWRIPGRAARAGRRARRSRRVSGCCGAPGRGECWC
jgi:predicted amidophosphoribosyltransferase